MVREVFGHLTHGHLGAHVGPEHTDDLLFEFA